ncbi:hypothetical protein [Streptomyces palmae]|uniref:Lipoprotein n=1 Tax=Streptomyces palmae TaxID=1701085 RepID=A0A4Z0GHF9_9ACTN|nr:hypothetical protein [Streptomyces palmae]TGA95244.1 hypothetical protein E4099_25825 [Streptomyces palmae]
MRTTPTLAALCAIAALSLTACGSDGSGDKPEKPEKADKTAAASGNGLTELTGPQIADKALKASKAATSFHVTMDGTVDGSPFTSEISSSTSAGCVGDMGMDGGHVKIIKKGDTTYAQYDAAFWKAQGKDGEDAAKLIGDRWTKTKASDPDTKDLTALCDGEQVLADAVPGAGNAEKGKTTTVDGKPAIILTEKDGDATYTLYVATEGKPYILKAVQKGGEDPGTMVFSDHDKPVKVTAPKAEDVLDLDAA